MNLCLLWETAAPGTLAWSPFLTANTGYGLRKTHLNPPHSLILRPHRGLQPLKLQEPQWSVMLQQKNKRILGGGWGWEWRGEEYTLLKLKVGIFKCQIL